MIRMIGVAAMAGLIGCSAPGAAGGGEVEALLPSVQATSLGDSVNFVLQVTNTTESAIGLSYPTGQSFDFVVSDATGAEVWRWSADRMFTQAVREEEIAAGETITFSAVWPVAGRPRGEYVVTGTLEVAGRSVEQRTGFRLP